MVALDSTLQGVVAADRLAMIEDLVGSSLVGRRLALFYGYFAAMTAVATVAARVQAVPVALDPEAVRCLLNVQAIHTFGLCAAFVGIRLLPVRIGRAIDVATILYTSSVGWFALSKMDRTESADIATISFFTLFFVVRAAIVPTRPWAAALVTTVAAVPLGVAMASLYRRSGGVDRAQAIAVTTGCFAASILAVTLVSKTIYGLRTAFAQAVQLGQYVVEEKIGEGAMGTVYRASHAMLKRPTAIKLVSPAAAGEAATARFEREVMAASGLTHPNNVAIYDYGRTQGGVFYYAMELLDGETLSQLVARDGPLPEARARRILAQVADALAEVHDAGLVHRDLKPENVMLVSRARSTDFVKVLDFGLAKKVGDAGDIALTGSRSIAGTPLYMAPEVIVAPDTVGSAADVYSFGCLAYFLLTGEPPFLGNNLVEVCAAHIHSNAEPPSASRGSACSPELDALVLRCLEKDPTARPSMVAVHDELIA